MNTHIDMAQSMSVTTGLDIDSRAKQLLWSSLTPTQRTLICTDGTLTLLLSAFLGEHIVSDSISTHIGYSNTALRCSEIVLTRNVTITTKGSRQPLVYATSEINLERVSLSIVDQLLTTSNPIGLILRSHKLETYREIIDWGHGDAPEFATDTQGEVLVYRTYAIISGKRTIMTITEYFDNNLMRSV